MSADPEIVVAASDEKIISLGSRRTLAAEARANIEAQEKFKKFSEESASQHQKDMIEILEAIIELVKSKKLDSFIIIGRNPDHGFFLDHIAMNPELTTAENCLAYAGKLDELKLVSLTNAAVGPFMDLKGVFYLSDPDLMELEDLDDE